MADQTGFAMETIDGLLIVAAPRTLDAATQPAFIATLSAMTDAATADVCIDLTSTEFMDSAGVGFIVKAHRQCEVKSGTLTIKGATDQPRKLLQSLEVDKHISLVD